MGPRSAVRQSGFVLLEALLAIALLIVISIGVAQLFAIAAADARNARDRTMATVLASAKLEQLESLAWDYVPAPAGMPAIPRSDWVSDLSREPQTSAGTGLLQAPPGTLDADTPPYVDFLDASGRWVGTGPGPPARAVYIRRWAVQSLPANPSDALIFQVLVTTVARERRRVAPRRVWTGEDVLLTTIRTRTAR